MVLLGSELTTKFEQNMDEEILWQSVQLQMCGLEMSSTKKEIWIEPQKHVAVALPWESMPCAPSDGRGMFELVGFVLVIFGELQGWLLEISVELLLSFWLEAPD